MKTSAEIFQETVSKLTPEEKRAIFPPKEMKNFVVRKSWYGRGQIIKFTNKKGVEIVYDHDIALDIMRPRLTLMPAWKKYGYWSQSTDIPLVLRLQKLLSPADQETYYPTPKPVAKKKKATPKKK